VLDVELLERRFRNPHPHFLVGGAPNPIDLNSDSAINAKRLSQVQEIIRRMREFVDQVYVPDTLAIASFYKDWTTLGEGIGNFKAAATELPADTTVAVIHFTRARIGSGGTAQIGSPRPIQSKSIPESWVTDYSAGIKCHPCARKHTGL